jgi:hypothetical protein
VAPLNSDRYRETENEITRFFKKVTGADLLLPDGWFGGRPMENIHRLTFVEARPKRLLLELGDHLLFSFSGPLRVEETRTTYALADGTPTLVIDSFEQLVVDFLEYGDETPHVYSYTTGRVCLVAPS